jgi:uncharacterized protein
MLVITPYTVYERAAGPFCNCGQVVVTPIRQEAGYEAINNGRFWLCRPSIFPVPAFMMRLVLGELGDVLMASSRAVPEKLLHAGFSFRFPDVESALLDLMNH